MSRVKNVAALDVYIKAVKSNLPQFGHEYQKASLDQVAADYVDFLEELLEKTPRPSKDLLVKSCKRVHPEVAPEAINSWAAKILETISHLRAKAKSSTSMVKISPKIKGLVRLLKKCKETDLSPSPEAKRGALKDGRCNSTSSFDLESEHASSSLHSAASREAIFAAYGVAADIPKKAMLAITDVVEIPDSQEAPNKMHSSSTGKPFQWFDAVDNCLKRKMKDGTHVLAEMRTGSNGFLIATFDGEDPIELEIPNMVLLPTVIKRPAAKKRPAAASKVKTHKKKPVKKLAKDDVDEDDEGEEEELDDPADDDVELEPVALKSVHPPKKTKVFFKYSNPYAYPNGSVAIRRVGPVSKKQVCSIVSKLPRVKVISIMSQLTKLLNDGVVSESDAKNWLKDNVK
jgi:hypothetical protein